MLFIFPQATVHAQGNDGVWVWDLDDPDSGFVNVETETSWRRVVGVDEYEIGVKVPYGGTFIHSARAYATYLFEVELRRSAGRDMDAGLIFDHDEGQNWSTFELHFDTRTFKVMRHQQVGSQGEWSLIYPETFSDAIRPAPERNRLSIARTATGYLYSINDVPVAQLPGSAAPSPFYLGVFVESEQDAPAAAIFSSVRVTSAPAAPTQPPAAPTQPVAPPAQPPAAPPVAPAQPGLPGLPGFPFPFPALTPAPAAP